MHYIRTHEVRLLRLKAATSDFKVVTCIFVDNHSWRETRPGKNQNAYGEEVSFGVGSREGRDRQRSDRKAQTVPSFYARPHLFSLKIISDDQRIPFPTNPSGFLIAGVRLRSAFRRFLFSARPLSSPVPLRPR